MNTRDKLIELLKQIDNDFGEMCVMCAEDGYKSLPLLEEFFADHLIASGVIVNEWRPASEPPKEEGMYLCINEGGDHFEAYYSQIYEEFGCDSAIYDHHTLGFLDTEWQGYSVSHWMPLPAPPKEVER